MHSANSECRYELIIENQKSWELPIYSSNSNYLIDGMYIKFGEEWFIIVC